MKARGGHAAASGGVYVYVGDCEQVVAHTSSVEVEVKEGLIVDQASYLRREGFRSIYERHHWGVQGQGSGSGSTLTASAPDRAFLTSLILDLGITSLLDAGCGSMHWQPPFLDHLHSHHHLTLHFHGLDIVASLIEEHQARFPNYTFSAVDMVNGPLPHGYDLILCRHALFHNTNEAIHSILRQFSTSGAQWLAATTLRHFPPHGHGDEEEDLMSDEGGGAGTSSGGGGGGGEASLSRELAALNSDGVLGTDGRALALGES